MTNHARAYTITCYSLYRRFRPLPASCVLAQWDSSRLLRFRFTVRSHCRVIFFLIWFCFSLFLPRGLCCHAVCVCLSVCVSVTFIHSAKTNKHIFRIFSPSGSHGTILVCPCQTAWQYSNGNPPNGGSNAGGVGRNRDSEPNIWLHCMLWSVPAARAIHLAATDHSEFITLTGERPSLLMVWNSDEVCDKNINVTPKTTLRSGKSEAYVTTIKESARVIILLRLTTDGHKARATSLQQQSYLSI